MPLDLARDELADLARLDVDQVVAVRPFCQFISRGAAIKRVSAEQPLCGQNREGAAGGGLADRGIMFPCPRKHLLGVGVIARFGGNAGDRLPGTRDPQLSGFRKGVAVVATEIIRHEKFHGRQARGRQYF